MINILEIGRFWDNPGRDDELDHTGVGSRLYRPHRRLKIVLKVVASDGHALLNAEMPSLRTSTLGHEEYKPLIEYFEVEKEDVARGPAITSKLKSRYQR